MASGTDGVSGMGADGVVRQEPGVLSVVAREQGNKPPNLQEPFRLLLSPFFHARATPLAPRSAALPLCRSAALPLCRRRLPIPFLDSWDLFRVLGHTSLPTPTPLLHSLLIMKC